MQSGKIRKRGERLKRRFQKFLQQETREKQERELEETEHGLNGYAVYTVCIFGLFALFAATSSIKTALWGFGIIHLGLTFGVLGLWWWERTLCGLRKNGGVPTRDTVFTKLPRAAQSPSITN